MRLSNRAGIQESIDKTTPIFGAIIAP